MREIRHHSLIDPFPRLQWLCSGPLNVWPAEWFCQNSFWFILTQFSKPELLHPIQRTIQEFVPLWWGRSSWVCSVQRQNSVWAAPSPPPAPSEPPAHWDRGATPPAGQSCRPDSPDGKGDKSKRFTRGTKKWLPCKFVASLLLKNQDVNMMKEMSCSCLDQVPNISLKLF